MKRIGILGGTFNPVHTEHINMAKESIAELKLDRLIIVPTFLPPHKSVIPESGEDRINMLKLAFCGEDKIEISDFEIKNGGKSYSYLTLEHYKKIFTEDELFFICGGDMLSDFKTWKYPEKILACATLAVFPRENYYTDFDYEREYFNKTFKRDFIKLSYVGKDFSSTEIRVRTALKLPIDGLTNKKVKEYIKERGLYKGGKLEKFVLENCKSTRILHIAGVIETAMQKVKELNLDGNKVYTAALLHDCAKYLDYRDYKDFTLEENVPPLVVHEFLGAYVAEHVLGIKDEEIIDAIRYHTTGKANMTTLGKLIFVADMVEKGRKYEGVEELREYYKGDLDECFRKCLKEELCHLINAKNNIFYETLNAYDYYVKE